MYLLQVKVELGCTHQCHAGQSLKKRKHRIFLCILYLLTGHHCKAVRKLNVPTLYLQKTCINNK